MRLSSASCSFLLEVMTTFIVSHNVPHCSSGSSSAMTQPQLMLVLLEAASRQHYRQWGETAELAD